MQFFPACTRTSLELISVFLHAHQYFWSDSTVCVDDIFFKWKELKNCKLRRGRFKFLGCITWKFLGKMITGNPYCFSKHTKRHPFYEGEVVSGPREPAAPQHRNTFVIGNKKHTFVLHWICGNGEKSINVNTFLDLLIVKVLRSKKVKVLSETRNP